MKKTLVMLSLLLGMSALNGWAQPAAGGNFDPAEMRQRMMDRYREMLEVKDDDEWNIIKVRLQDVMTARRELSAAGGRMMGGMGPGGGASGSGRGNRGQGGGGPGGVGPQGDNSQRRMNMPGMESMPELEALQKALEAKASKEEVKDKLTKLREARKTKEAKLEKAQEELTKVLSSRQEAQAVVMGLLK